MAEEVDVHQADLRRGPSPHPVRLVRPLADGGNFAGRVPHAMYVYAFLEKTFAATRRRRARIATPWAWPSSGRCATPTAAPSCRTMASAQPSPSLMSLVTCKWGNVSAASIPCMRATLPQAEHATRRRSEVHRLCLVVLLELVLRLVCYVSNARPQHKPLGMVRVQSTLCHQVPRVSAKKSKPLFARQQKP